MKEDSVKLVWSFDCPQLIDCYWVYRGGTQVNGDVPPNQKWLIDTGVQRGAQYVYQVYAKKGSNSSPPSRTILVQVPWVDAPTLRQAVELPPNQVKISWHNNSNYAINYTISRWDTLHGWQDSYKVNYTDTVFTDTVSFFHKYRYRVKAKDSQGHYSVWSNVVEYFGGMLAQSNYPKISAYNNGAYMQKPCLKFFADAFYPLTNGFF